MVNMAEIELKPKTKPSVSRYARKRTKELPDAWKERIRAGVIMDKLLKCVNGQLEMDANRIRAAEILLRKIVPDLQRSELTGADGKDLYPQMTDEQMLDRLKNLIQMARHAEQPRPIQLESRAITEGTTSGVTETS